MTLEEYFSTLTRVEQSRTKSLEEQTVEIPKGSLPMSTFKCILIEKEENEPFYLMEYRQSSKAFFLNTCSFQVGICEFFQATMIHEMSFVQSWNAVVDFQIQRSMKPVSLYTKKDTIEPLWLTSLKGPMWYISSILAIISRPKVCSWWTPTWQRCQDMRFRLSFIVKCLKPKRKW